MNDALEVAGGRGTMTAESKRLLDVLGALGNELGSRGDAEQLHTAAPVEEPVPAATLGEADEQFVAALRAGLARLAGAGGPAQTDAATSLRGALDGAELLARSEILVGQRERLAQLLPSFAFLALLPQVGRAEALRVSRRAGDLLDATQPAG